MSFLKSWNKRPRKPEATLRTLL